eukprot:GHRR01035066.1.p1 GENE.GHRR01035066.1~~GHRR01035066.1.p1  ORF type:complete len:164 (+),score=13.25 GHRR01035066.1:271-762(+)
MQIFSMWQVQQVPSSEPTPATAPVTFISLLYLLKPALGQVIPAMPVGMPLLQNKHPVSLLPAPNAAAVGVHATTYPCKAPVRLADFISGSLGAGKRESSDKATPFPWQFRTHRKPQAYSKTDTQDHIERVSMLHYQTSRGLGQPPPGLTPPPNGGQQLVKAVD